MVKTLWSCVLLALIWSLQGCVNDGVSVNRAFYYWKSNDWQIASAELGTLDSLDVKKVYVKFFEVDRDPELGCHPISKTELSIGYTFERRNISIVPTIYIRNNVFKNISTEELDLLADNTHFLIQKFINDDHQTVAVDEYQMDCDWTQSTKENYFYFF